MDPRHADVLTALINQYVRTARPVGSSALVDYLNWDISSATMRSLLQDLEEGGFIYQPHTSAGRVPTDQGYRYFVNHLSAPVITPAERTELAAEYDRLTGEYHEAARSLSLLLARLSRLMAVCSAPQSRRVFDSGLTELLNQPDEDLVDAMREVSIVLDHADSEAAALAEQGSSQAQAFIGEEIPFFPARHTSLVVRSIGDKNERLVLMIVGPKRMSYDRNLALLNSLADIVNEKIL